MRTRENFGAGWAERRRVAVRGRTQVCVCVWGGVTAKSPRVGVFVALSKRALTNKKKVGAEKKLEQKLLRNRTVRNKSLNKKVLLGPKKLLPLTYLSSPDTEHSTAQHSTAQHSTEVTQRVAQAFALAFVCGGAPPEPLREASRLRGGTLLACLLQRD